MGILDSKTNGTCTHFRIQSLHLASVNMCPYTLCPCLNNDTGQWWVWVDDSWWDHAQWQWISGYWQNWHLVCWRKATGGETWWVGWLSQLAIELMSSTIEPVHTVENVLMKHSCSASTSRQTNLMVWLIPNWVCFQKDNLMTWCLCFCFGPSQQKQCVFQICWIVYIYSIQS